MDLYGLKVTTIPENMLPRAGRLKRTVRRSSRPKWWTLLLTISILLLLQSEPVAGRQRNRARRRTTRSPFSSPGESLEPPFEYEFTRSVYQATIEECQFICIGGRRVVPEVPITIPMPGSPTPARTITPYEVKVKNLENVLGPRAGGKDKGNFFSADVKQVGDRAFVFLRLSNTTTQLNREKFAGNPPRFDVRLKVYAFDARSHTEPVALRTRIQVTVTDINDIAPFFIFDNPEVLRYERVLSADTAPGTEVLHVRTKDRDTGPYAESYYYMDDLTDEEKEVGSGTGHARPFAVHPTTGKVFVTHPLVALPEPYAFDIKARNRVPSAFGEHMATARVRIRVSKPVPTPIMDVRQLASVVNPLAYGTSLAVITMTSSDGSSVPPAPKITSVISGSSDVTGTFAELEAEEEVGPTRTYVLRVSTALRNPGDKVNITLTASSYAAGSGPTAVRHVAFPVLRVRKPAQIDDPSKPIAVEWDETALIGTPLYHFPSPAEAVSITYKIVTEAGYSGGLGMTRVDAGTGVLLTAGLVVSNTPHEWRLAVNQTIELVGGGGGPEYVRRRFYLMVTVVDFNDHSPEFEFIGPPEFSFSEATPSQQDVYTVKAVDDDRGDNGLIIYSLVKVVDEESVPFEIDSSTGVIRLTAQVDYERSPEVYRLRVRASDLGSPYRRETEQVITARVANVNDNEPVFDKSACTIRVSDAYTRSTLLDLDAIDPDGDLLSYSLTSASLSRDPSQCYAIESGGKLSTKCRRAIGTEETVVVMVTDAKYSSDLHVIVKTVSNGARSLLGRQVSADCETSSGAAAIRDMMAAKRARRPPTPTFTSTSIVNRHYPTFQRTVETIASVSEGEPVGFVIARFEADDADEGFLGYVTYWIRSGNDDGQFIINRQSGELSLMAPLDRERRTEHALVISARDWGSPHLDSSVKVRITVGDVNDCSPRFRSGAVVRTVSEDAPYGTTVVELKAVDSDEGNFGTIRYSIQDATSTSKHFDIDPTSGRLFVSTHSLDRETKSRYTLEIRAEDKAGVQPDHSAVVTVTVDVTDVNDNAPVFPADPIVIRVAEDMPVGSLVSTIAAHDADLGDNSDLSYSLNGQLDLPFQMDPETGIILLVSPLDYEGHPDYILTVTARDNGRLVKSTTAKLKILVTDVVENLYTPEFQLRVYNGSVRENMPRGTPVVRVRAEDDDSMDMGGSGRGISRGLTDRGSRGLTYSIRGDSGMGRFYVDNAGWVRTLLPLDRETTDHYWLTVWVTDGGTAPRSSSVPLHVTVEDVNDNAPIPSHRMYEASVPVNASQGTTVVNISVTDPDIGPGGESFTYGFEEIIGHRQRAFVINKKTGQIQTSSRSLKGEEVSTYEMTIRISDGGSPSLSSLVKVIIHVTDINEFKPKLLPAVFGTRQFFVLSNHPISRPIFRAVATDQDGETTSLLKYSLQAEEGVNASVRIESDTGYVYTTQPLTTGDDVHLDVMVSDPGPDVKTSIEYYTVNVLAPFTLPAGKNIAELSPLAIKTSGAGVVSESTKVHGMANAALNIEGALLGAVVYFDIVGGNFGDCLAVKHFSPYGEAWIVVARPLDYEQWPVYQLNISATDGLRTVYKKVVITVVDANEFPPSFTKELYTVAVAEATPVGTWLMAVEAEDKDAGSSLYYRIQGYGDTQSKDVCSIDPASGSLRLVKPLDHETTRSHTIIVEVVDTIWSNYSSSHQAFTTVRIDVTDSNDHAPSFVSDSKGRSLSNGGVFADVQVSSRAARGTVVAEIAAYDQDKGRNAEIVYAIESGNIGFMFSMDPDLGIISLSKSLDEPHWSEFTLLVSATDKGIPPRHNVTRVKVRVVPPINDKPRFESERFAGEVEENRPAGTFILALSGRAQSLITYRIVGGNDLNTFTISPNSGILTTLVPLDYETRSVYALTVVAHDLHGNSVSLSVAVRVTDANDHRPYFEQAVYYGEIGESTPPGGPVLASEHRLPLVVTAKDADANLNALVSYRIEEEAAREFFAVSSTTGTITSLQPLDREENSHFEFTVVANDQGQSSLTSAIPVRVIISVTDLNDSPPRFEHDTYEATLFVPTYAGVLVTTVKAIDPDVTGNLSYAIVSTGGHRVSDDSGSSRFFVGASSGEIRVAMPQGLTGSKTTPFTLELEVNDGVYSSRVQVNVFVTNVGFDIAHRSVSASTVENSAEVVALGVASLAGAEVRSARTQAKTYTLLNYNSLFVVHETSGVLKTKGIPFDREKKASYRLIVKIKLTDDSIRQLPVDVSIIDANDNAPRFYRQPYFGMVNVNTPVEHRVLSVFVEDDDAPGMNSALQLRITGGNGGRHFKVNNKGVVSLRKKFSQPDINRKYTLTVTASDKGIVPLSDSATVTLVVSSNHTPSFIQPVYRVSVPENMPAQSLIASVLARSAQGKKVLYSITAGDVYNEFLVHFSTGDLVVNDWLDYERKSLYDLTLRATDMSTGHWSETIVQIAVKDKNDHSPVFTESVYHVTASEVVSPSYKVVQVSATDEDSGTNGQVRYQITGVRPGSSYSGSASSASEASMAYRRGVRRSRQDDSIVAELLPSSGHRSETGVDVAAMFSIDSESGEIRTRRLFDSADTSVGYTIVVKATDGGSPAQSSEAHIVLKLTDVNNHVPVFAQSVYRLHMSELAPRGQFVTSVGASDMDFSDEGRLQYAIVGGNSGRAFEIVSKTGAVRVSGLHEPIYETFYRLNVSAHDGVFTSFAAIEISVMPANKNTPRCEKSYSFQIPEDARKGTVLNEKSPVVALDADEGEFGRIRYYLEGSRQRKLFNLGVKSGILSLASHLGDLPSRIYNLIVRAEDGGRKTAFCSVYIALSDVNNHSPKFHVREYRPSIPANSPKGLAVLRVHANDIDHEANGRVTYSFDGDSSHFLLDETTGLLITKDTEFTEGEQFPLRIRASDEGIPQMSSTVSVLVRVVEANAVIPAFKRPMQKVGVNEDESIGETVAQARINSQSSAALRRAGAASAEYAFVEASSRVMSQQGSFNIAPNGTVTIEAPLDYESTSQYYFVIKAYDPARPDIVGYLTLSISVDNVNDNAPMFDTAVANVHVLEDVPIGTAFMKISAHDADEPNVYRGNIRFSMAKQSRDLANVFRVDPIEGWVSTLIPLDRETRSNYTFFITVEDNKGGSSTAANGGKRRGRRVIEQMFSSTASVTLTLIDVNDVPPQFASGQVRKVYVREDSPINTTVLKILATDGDMAQDGGTKLGYSITGGNELGHFRIRPGGNIITSHEFDWENKREYDLTVTVTDGIFVNSLGIYIPILDVNDNTPYCDEARHTIKVPENARVTKNVLDGISASDADDPNGESGRLVYTLSGDHADDFEMDKRTGRMLISHDLDRESVPKYDLVAKVTDQGGLYCTTDIIIVVTDVNDNTPTFTQPSYEYALPENSAPNTMLLRATATDGDTLRNKEVTYSLEGPGAAYLKIDSRSGLVSITQSITRAHAKAVSPTSPEVVTATIVARDNGSPTRLNGTATLTVFVIDENDPPRFERTRYEKHVAEDVPAGMVVQTVRASSRGGVDDLGDNGVVEYRIVDEGADHSKFAIDKNTGEIRSVGLFDHEQVTKYALTVEAKDKGEPPLSDRATVYIRITDVNDNRPVFPWKEMMGEVAEDAQAGTVVATVAATDSDSGVNAEVRYKIMAGDRERKFTVHEKTGVVSTLQMLDREQQSEYVLTIQAHDLGIVPKSNSLRLVVKVMDINDNAPEFRESDYSTVVQEGGIKKYQCLRVDAIDADLAATNRHLTYSLIPEADTNPFMMTDDGRLMATGEFSRSAKSTYYFSISVSDSGSPRRSSTARVVVTVIPSSPQRPSLNAPLSISVSTTSTSFAGGVIGRIHANDPDPGSVLRYETILPYTYFRVADRTTGTLRAEEGLVPGQHSFNVRVSDGRWEDEGQVFVSVVHISPAVTREAVGVVVKGIGEREFAERRAAIFESILQSSLRAGAVEVTGGDDFGANLIVHFISVKNTARSALSRNRRAASTTNSASLWELFIGAITNQKTRNRRSKRSGMAPSVEVVFAVEAVRRDGSGDRSVVRQEELREFVETQQSFLEKELGGEVRVVTHDSVCADMECPKGKGCVGEYNFENAPPYAVQTRDSVKVYSDGRVEASCVCEGDACADPCRDNPCTGYKLCRRSATNPLRAECVCPPGQYGAHCSIAEGSSITLTRRSRIAWTIKQDVEAALDLYLEFKTLRADGVIMDARGDTDYQTLEINNGHLTYSFNCGSGPAELSISKKVNDGSWHSLRVERKKNTAKMELDGVHSSQDDAPGTRAQVNLNENALHFGSQPFSTESEGFEGCLKEMKLFGEYLPYDWENDIADLEVKESINYGCSAPCVNSPCNHGGSCLFCADWERGCGVAISGARCACSEGYSGGLCEKALFVAAAPNITIFIVAGVVGAVLIIIIIIAVICIVRRNRSSRKGKSSNPTLLDSRCEAYDEDDSRIGGQSHVYVHQPSPQPPFLHVDGQLGQHPPVPPRPLSYTPSIELTQFDRAHNYGSSGSEDEDIDTFGKKVTKQNHLGSNGNVVGHRVPTEKGYYLEKVKGTKLRNFPAKLNLPPPPPSGSSESNGSSELAVGQGRGFDWGQAVPYDGADSGKKGNIAGLAAPGRSYGKPDNTKSSSFLSLPATENGDDARSLVPLPKPLYTPGKPTGLDWDKSDWNDQPFQILGADLVLPDELAQYVDDDDDLGVHGPLLGVLGDAVLGNSRGRLAPLQPFRGRVVVGAGGRLEQMATSEEDNTAVLGGEKEHLLTRYQSDSDEDADAESEGSDVPDDDDDDLENILTNSCRRITATREMTSRDSVREGNRSRGIDMSPRVLGAAGGSALSSDDLGAALSVDPSPSSSHYGLNRGHLDDYLPRPPSSYGGSTDGYQGTPIHILNGNPPQAEATSGVALPRLDDYISETDAGRMSCLDETGNMTDDPLGFGNNNRKGATSMGAKGRVAAIGGFTCSSADSDSDPDIAGLAQFDDDPPTDYDGTLDRRADRRAKRQLRAIGSHGVTVRTSTSGSPRRHAGSEMQTEV